MLRRSAFLPAAVFRAEHQHGRALGVALFVAAFYRAHVTPDASLVTGGCSSLLHGTDGLTCDQENANVSQTSIGTGWSHNR